MKTLTRVAKGLPIVPDMWKGHGRYNVTKAQIKREEKLRRWLEAERVYRSKGVRDGKGF